MVCGRAVCVCDGLVVGVGSVVVMVAAAASAGTIASTVDCRCRLSGTDLYLGNAAADVAAAAAAAAAVVAGSATLVTRKRENFLAPPLPPVWNAVGEQLLDIEMPRRPLPAAAVAAAAGDGDVVTDCDWVAIGLVSSTRDTWKRLRDGDGVGDGFGLGAGERRRLLGLRSPGLRSKRSAGWGGGLGPVVVVTLGLAAAVAPVVPGSPRWSSALGRMLWHVSEILRELRCEPSTRLLMAVVRTGSGLGGFSLRAHWARMLCTMRE